MNKPRGYFKYLLAIDCETSGMAYGEDDPSINTKTGEIYQSVSWGLIVVDASTLNPIEELYLEIKWDGISAWTAEAERIHGLSLSYLEDHGLTAEDAVIAIAELILKYWGPESPVCLAGHNVHLFDLQFLKRLLRSQGINIKFGNRHVDTNSIGFGVFNTYNSDDLFKLVGCNDRTSHNSLEDARDVVRVLQTTRKMYDNLIDMYDKTTKIESD